MNRGRQSSDHCIRRFLFSQEFHDIQQEKRRLAGLGCLHDCECAACDLSFRPASYNCVMSRQCARNALTRCSGLSRCVASTSARSAASASFDFMPVSLAEPPRRRHLRDVAPSCRGKVYSSPIQLEDQTFESGEAALRLAMYSSSASSIAGSIGGRTYSASCFFHSVLARLVMSGDPSASHCS